MVNPDLEVLMTFGLETHDINVEHYAGDKSGMPEHITISPKYRKP